MRASLKKVFMARYVLLAEVFGYAIAFFLLGLWILFFFIRKEEYCFSPGVVKPAALEITLKNRAVLKSAEAANETLVEKGQIVFRLNTDKKAIAARQAQADLSSLGEQVVTLATNPTDRSSIQKSVAGIVGEVGGLATGDIPVDVRAPEAGLLSYTISTTSTASHPVVEGRLAQVVSDKILWFEGDMGELNRNRVTIGLPAHLEMKLDPEQPNLGMGRKIVRGIKKGFDKVRGKQDEKSYRVQGKVAKLPGGNKVVIEAPVTNEKVGKRLSDQILHPSSAEGADNQLKAEARIVVGNVRLVSYLFKKSATTAKKQEEVKKESFFKRTWHTLFPPAKPPAPTAPSLPSGGDDGI